MKKFFPAFVMALMLVPMLFATPTASATKPVILKTYTYDCYNDNYEFKQHNGILFIQANSHCLVGGDMVGKVDNTFWAEFRPNGHVTARSLDLFQVTVMGQTGTITVFVSANLAPKGNDKLIVGGGTILKGTGELANIHGTFAAIVEDGLVVGQEWKIHFDPT